jgi:hypothetical protein
MAMSSMPIRLRLGVFLLRSCGRGPQSDARENLIKGIGSVMVLEVSGNHLVMSTTIRIYSYPSVGTEYSGLVFFQLDG